MVRTPMRSKLIPDAVVITTARRKPQPPNIDQCPQPHAERCQILSSATQYSPEGKDTGAVRRAEASHIERIHVP